MRNALPRTYLLLLILGLFALVRGKDKLSGEVETKIHQLAKEYLNSPSIHEVSWKV
jgi:hypothetical protein